MEKVDSSLVDNELIFPTEETLSTTHSFMALKEGKQRQYQGDIADVIGTIQGRARVRLAGHRLHAVAADHADRVGDQVGAEDHCRLALETGHLDTRLDATRGIEEHDLSNYLRGARRVAEGLDRDPPRREPGSTTMSAVDPPLRFWPLNLVARGTRVP